jgi:nicotinate-nucleotide adenylyltransferase
VQEFGLIVYPRPGGSAERLDNSNIAYVEAPQMDISATFIRKCIRQEKSIRYLVPDAVGEFIRDRKFFQ